GSKQLGVRPESEKIRPFKPPGCWIAAVIGARDRVRRVGIAGSDAGGKLQKIRRWKFIVGSCRTQARSSLILQTALPFPPPLLRDPLPPYAGRWSAPEHGGRRLCERSPPRSPHRLAHQGAATHAARRSRPQSALG